MRIRLKGYYPCATFEVTTFKGSDKKNIKYIRFSSRENSKKIFDFYKQDVCHGEKPSAGTCLADAGFFDCGYKHWTEFERFNKRIVYSFVLSDGILEITPIHWRDSDSIDNELILDV